MKLLLFFKLLLRCILDNFSRHIAHEYWGYKNNHFTQFLVKSNLRANGEFTQRPAAGLIS